MSYHEPRPLRLMVGFEAEALITNSGGEAYAAACRRAEEASNEMLARDLARSRAHDRSQWPWGAPPDPSNQFGSLAILIAHSNGGRAVGRGTAREFRGRR